MKIATRGLQRAEQRAVIGEAAGDQMQHITVAFEYAVHTEQTRTQQFAALAFGEVTPHDDVHVAGFILERDEDHARGGARALATGDDAGRMHGPAKRRIAQFGGGDKTQTLQTAA